MLTIRKLAENRSGDAGSFDLTLTFDERKKSRLRTRLDDGTEVALLLERGTILRGDDVLVTDDGQLVRVRAAPELVSTVRAPDARALARAAYHLGNRHVPLQVGEGWVRYEHDHVLDDLAAALGLDVVVELASFEPEAGSYAGRGASAHHHEHGHEHEHEHEDPPGQRAAPLERPNPDVRNA